jgi:large subunit ribosomal protein L14e
VGVYETYITVAVPEVAQLLRSSQLGTTLLSPTRYLYEVLGMPLIEVGRVCVKLMGREAGRKCVIVDIVDDNFVVVTGPKSLTGVKRRRANIRHLEILDKKVEIEKGASDEEVLKAIEAVGLVEFMKERVKIDRRTLLKLATVVPGER